MNNPIKDQKKFPRRGVRGGEYDTDKTWSRLLFRIRGKATLSFEFQSFRICRSKT